MGSQARAHSLLRAFLHSAIRRTRSERSLNIVSKSSSTRSAATNYSGYTKPRMDHSEYAARCMHAFPAVSGGFQPIGSDSALVDAIVAPTEHAGSGHKLLGGEDVHKIEHSVQGRGYFSRCRFCSRWMRKGIAHRSSRK